MSGSEDLYKAAERALKDYLGVSADETLLVLTDEKMRDIAMALYETGRDICSEAIYVEMRSREINGQEPPAQIAEMMKNVDVIIAPTSKSLTHTVARRDASRLGVRIGTMPGITPDAMIRCLGARFNKIIELTEIVGKKMRHLSTIRVTTKKGTDLLMEVKGRRPIESTGVLRNIGESGNIPSGEVYLAPLEKKSNGIVVFDGSFAQIGLLDEPITIEIKDGYAVNILGGEQADFLRDTLTKIGRDAFAVGEFGIGTNYKAKLTGNILEDEKVLGTIHIAFGNNLSMGGRISVPSHLDGLVQKPTVYFDDEMIMQNGKMLLGQ